MYQILALVFFTTLLCGLLILISFATSFRHHKHWRKIVKAYVLWLCFYSLFITFFTGPVGTRLYENSLNSPYKLPWRSGVSRFVSQGNRSFTSHRGLHLYAWDFWMSIGSDILAARAGKVIEVEQSFDGIGPHSNYILIEHEDGTRAMYAHIKKNGSKVRVGDNVEQGKLIGYSGMVGQTINPHLHFVVLNREGTDSLPITFSDVPGGVPLAGRTYQSSNE